MIKWTTPTLCCSIPKDINLDYLILSLKQGTTLLEKTVDKGQIDEEGNFTVFLTQEDTGLFNMFKKVEAQVNIIFEDVRMATNIVEVQFTENLHDEVIENG